MKGLVRKVVLGVAAGIAVYVGFSIWANARDVGAALAQFDWTAALWGLLLAAGNYAVRWVRWEYYLRRLNIRIATRDSVLVFLSGFALTVTPGKLGEAVKALLLRQTHGISATRTAPIVVAERITDLTALLALALAGAFTLPVDRGFLGAGAIAVAVALLLIGSEAMGDRLLSILARVGPLARFIPKLRASHRTAATLLRPGPLLITTVLSVASWFLECLAFWIIVRGLPGARLILPTATFIYAAMTVAGALSFLPGGLGVTEAGMLALLGTFATGVGRGGAAAATFVTRACTLWFAVAVGLLALMIYSRRAGGKTLAITDEPGTSARTPAT